ncbi:hypothetical protein [Actinosynnema sp.]|uniref:hypothetical protein n=1 Tax=Actinosynnema sp. TaxID=1872144 RepID=UPI003F87B834
MRFASTTSSDGTLFRRGVEFDGVVFAAAAAVLETGSAGARIEAVRLLEDLALAHPELRQQAVDLLRSCLRRRYWPIPEPEGEGKAREVRAAVRAAAQSAVTRNHESARC